MSGIDKLVVKGKTLQDIKPMSGKVNVGLKRNVKLGSGLLKKRTKGFGLRNPL